MWQWVIRNIHNCKLNYSAWTRPVLIATLHQQHIHITPITSSKFYLYSWISISLSQCTPLIWAIATCHAFHGKIITIYWYCLFVQFHNQFGFVLIMNSMKLVILLHSLCWSIHTKDELIFTPKMNSSLVWIDSGIVVSQHRLGIFSSWNKM